MVFLFLVERQLDDWPEKAERETRWFEPTDAYASVDEGGFAEIIAARDACWSRAIASRISHHLPPKVESMPF